MSKTFHLQIVTPTSSINFEDVEYLRAPGVDGLFGVQAGHASALISLQIGELKIVINGKEEFWATSGGYAEVTSEQVQLLLETVEASSKVDAQRAEAALERAKSRLTDSGMDSARAQVALMRAINRIRVSQR